MNNGDVAVGFLCFLGIVVIALAGSISGSLRMVAEQFKRMNDLEAAWERPDEEDLTEDEDWWEEDDGQTNNS